MKILDTFFILFKSNADEVVKGNKDIEKSTQDVERGLKNTGYAADALGSSFVKMINSAANAATAAVGFTAIKAGVLSANDLNSTLYITSKLTGQNIHQLQAMGNAAAAAGGSMSGALADASNYSANAASMGIKAGSFPDFLRKVREDIWKRAPNDPNIRAMLAQKAGLSDPGNIFEVAGADNAEFNSYVAQGEKFSTVTDRMAKSARDFEAARAALASSKHSFWSKAADDTNSATTHAMNSGADGLQGASGSSLGTWGVIGGATVAGNLASKGLLKYAARLLGLGGTAAAEGGAAAVAGTEAAAGASGAAAVAGVGGAAALGLGAVVGAAWLPAIFHKSLSKWIDHQVHGKEDAAMYARHHGGNLPANGDMAFWMGKGYSREQAAAIMANIQAESGGNPRARGDGGRAVGDIQWHPDRVQGMLKGTGIDVRTASHEQQREALAWEMKNLHRRGWNDAEFRKIAGADDAASYLSQRFIAPADRYGQALKRGQMALNIASGYNAPAGGSGQTSVSIGKIEIVTQATDARGIAQTVGDHLSSMLRSVQGNHDDGVAA